MKKIVIVGNNVFTELAILILLKLKKADDFQIVHLIEDDADIGSEITILPPSFYRTAEKTNLDVEYLRKKLCANYHLGTQYQHWSKGSGKNRFFLPYASELDRFYRTTFENNIELRLKGYDILAHPDEFNFMAVFANSSAHNPISPYHFPFSHEYGLSVDSVELRKFMQKELSKYSNERFIQLDSTILSIEKEPQNNGIEQLTLDNGDIITGDFFIDTTLTHKLSERAQTGNLTHQKIAISKHSTSVSCRLTLPKSPPLFNQNIACEEGYMLFNSTGLKLDAHFYYDASLLSHEQAYNKLLSRLNTLFPTYIELTCHRAKNNEFTLAKHAYVGNTLKLGLSYCDLPRLTNANQDIYFFMIDTFIELLNKGSSDERVVMNDNIAAFSFSALDFQYAFYGMSNRKGQGYSLDFRATKPLTDNLQSIIGCWLQGHAILEQQIPFPSFATATQWNTLLAGLEAFPEQSSLTFVEQLNQFSLDEIRDFYDACLTHYIY